MVSQHESSGESFWFGVSMFLIGLIAGGVLMGTFGSASFNLGAKTGTKAQNNPTAPAQAQQQPQQPQVNIQERLLNIAGDIGLDKDEFKTCVASGKFKQKFTDEQKAGTSAGVNGTPGNILYNTKTKNGLLIAGARPIDDFKKYIDLMLKDPNYQSQDPNVPNAKNVPEIDTGLDHIRGNANAELAVIEYVDFQCPFCQKVHPTLQTLLGDYGNKMMWVTRNFPLSFHPDAEPLATGAECAAELGGNEAYWNFADKIFE